jgi:DNA-binding NarL/FixJ family response regulator
MGAADLFRTLIVEDDVALRVLLRRALEGSKRFEVVGEAGDGLAAIEAATRLQPDLILLDLMMPVMNGFQALPLLVKAAPGSRIVVLSVLQGNPIERECRDLGASAFIDKMVQDDELVRKVLGVLESEQPIAPRVVAARLP